MLDTRALAQQDTPAPTAVALSPFTDPQTGAVLASCGADAPTVGAVAVCMDASGTLVLARWTETPARPARAAVPATDTTPAVPAREAREASGGWKRTARVTDFGRAQIAGILA